MPNDELMPRHYIAGPIYDRLQNEVRFIRLLIHPEARKPGFIYPANDSCKMIMTTCTYSVDS